MKKKKKDHPAPKRERGKQKQESRTPARSAKNTRKKAGSRQPASKTHEDTRPVPRTSGRKASRKHDLDEDDEIYQDRYARRRFSEREEDFEKKDQADYWDREEYPEHLHTRDNNSHDVNDRYENRPGNRDDGYRRRSNENTRYNYNESNYGSGRNTRDFDPRMETETGYRGRHGWVPEVPRYKHK